MEFSYWPEYDQLYICLVKDEDVVIHSKDRPPIHPILHITDWMRIDFDDEKKPIGIEIDWASKHFNLAQIVLQGFTGTDIQIEAKLERYNKDKLPLHFRE